MRHGRQGSSEANLSLLVGLVFDDSLAMRLKRSREVDSFTRTMELVYVKKVCSSPSVSGADEHTPPFTINALCWNCRGLGDSRVVQALLGFTQHHPPYCLPM